MHKPQASQVFQTILVRVPPHFLETGIPYIAQDQAMFLLPYIEQDHVDPSSGVIFASSLTERGMPSGSMGINFGDFDFDSSLDTLLVRRIRQVVGTPRDWAPLSAIQQTAVPVSSPQSLWRQSTVDARRKIYEE